MPCVVIAAVHIIEVTLETVALARTGHNVHVVHVALCAVEHHATGLSERSCLEHCAGKTRPVCSERLVADHVRMRLEVDDADRLVAFAVDAENLHLLVRRRAVGLIDLRIVHTRIRAHLAVLHEVAASERDALRDGTLIGHFRRLEVCQCVHGGIRNAGDGHAPVDV